MLDDVTQIPGVDRGVIILDAAVEEEINNYGNDNDLENIPEPNDGPPPMESDGGQVYEPPLTM